MAAGRWLMGSKAVIARRGQRRRRNQPAENAGSAREASAAVPPGSPAPQEEDHGSAERARLLRKASAHAWMAVQISELMQGNVAESEDLRRLTGSLQANDQQAGGSGGGPLPASASLRNEIKVLDRIIAWQIRTINWHRDEGRRLREQEARIRVCQALGDAADPTGDD
jgi:hypothetical protein